MKLSSLNLIKFGQPSSPVDNVNSSHLAMHDSNRNESSEIDDNEKRKFDDDGVEDVLNSSELAYDEDQSMRPSRIPVLKQKYTDDDSVNRFTNSVETNDSLKSMSLSSTPTSPITGKKYRVPLCSRSKPADRSKKLDNGTSENGNEPESNRNFYEDNSHAVENDTRNGSNDDNSSYNLDVNSSMKNPAKVRDDASGRSTPVSISNMSINVKSRIPTLTNSPSPERKPRLKWMFGPHRNANVVSSPSPCVNIV